MPPAEERRLVTLLFADLVGFTGQAEESDPEAVRDLQRAYFGSVAAEVARYGGVVEKYIGDAAMAIFGAPQAHDDDAERALRAALGIRDAVHRLPQAVEVRIGVTTGEVVGGAGEGSQAGDYTVTGDAVNVAARLQQAAAPGAILVGSPTYRLERDSFAFAGPQRLALKGRRQPVETWQLVGERPHRRPVGTSTALVGRRFEREALRAAVEQTSFGQGAVLTLVGEAGIGKSRLAEEVREMAAASGFACYWANARSYASAVPYFLLSQLAREFVARSQSQPVTSALAAVGVAAASQTLERWAAVLGELLGESDRADLLAEVVPSGRQYLLLRAMQALMRARAAAQPVLVVLDDLHWIDAASLTVLDELVDIPVDLPVLLLAVYRPGWTHAWSEKRHYREFNIGGLQAAEARELADLLCGERRLPDDVTRRVLDRAAGNPFFLEELLLSSEQRSPETSDQGLPETVHEVLLARIDALPSLARHALQLGSVVGMEFSEEVLRAVVDRPDVENSLHALQREGLVLRRPVANELVEYAFRHPLIHEVAYRSLLVARRRELHRRIARHLEKLGGDDLVPAIAAHYRDGEEAEKAVDYLRRAAERAAQLFATREALDGYREAARFAADASVRAQLVERASHQSYLLGDAAGAIGLVHEAMVLYEQAGDELHALGCRSRLGRYSWMAGRGEEAERHIAAAIGGLERLPPSEELALAYSYRSQVRMRMPDYPAAVQWAEKAILVAETVGSVPTLVHAYNNLGVSLDALGDTRGRDYLRRSLAMALEHSLPDDAGRAYLNLSASNPLSHLPYPDADAFWEEASAYLERTYPGGAYDQALRWVRADFLVPAGRWEEADALLVELRRMTRGTGYSDVAAAWLQARLATHRGQHDAAHDLLTPHVADALRIGDLQVCLPVFTFLAHAEAGRGNDEQAARAIGRAVELRSEAEEASLSAWFLFEATDVAAAIARRGDERVLHVLVPILRTLRESIVTRTSRVPAADEAELREAMLEAVRAQLARLQAFSSPEQDTSDSEGWRSAAATLDKAYRTFDAARVRLWAAESGVSLPRGEFREAQALFERLGAVPYIRAALNRSML